VRRERNPSTTKATIAGGALAVVLVVLLALVAGHRAPRQTLDQEEEPAAVTSPSSTLATAEAASEAHQGFIFGRVTTYDSAIYEGRLRFGGDEEAFWGDYFNGVKDENPWVAHAPLEQLRERRQLEIFGVEVFHWERQVDLARPFMARFGDIARIEANGRDLRVTLKSGTVFHLDRFAADDFADGVRVWDGGRGVVDLDEPQIRSIDLVPTGRPGTAPDRLHGTVRTRGGDFTGFIQWNRQKGVASDELDGHTADGELRLRFDTVRSIARKSPDSSLVTLLDGKEIVLTDTSDVGPIGMYVDDRRYGRVLIRWDAFERVDFSPGGSGPAYGDFPTGLPLTGDVTTRDGRRLAGRLVYDLDESETTETLDAPSRGVPYNILFGLIDSIVLPAPEERDVKGAKVTFHSGEVLQLELAGDLGEGNAGMLIFVVDGRKQPEYVRWTEIKQIHFDRPSAMYPPLERR
jgi:hypothetical protein